LAKIYGIPEEIALIMSWCLRSYPSERPSAVELQTVFVGLFNKFTLEPVVTKAQTASVPATPVSGVYVDNSVIFEC
jgi:hypothetical protein